MPIDLGTPSLVWMAEHKPKRLADIERRYSHFAEPQRYRIIESDIVADYVGSNLNLIVSKVEIEPKSTIRVFVLGPADSREISRMMQASFLHDGVGFAFRNLDAQVETTSDRYMGEWSDSHTAKLVFEYAPAGRRGG